MEQQRIDWPSFGLCAAIILCVAVPLFVFPDESGVFLEASYTYISNQFGVLYLLASVAAIGFLAWLAFSRFGNVRLGDTDDGKP